MYYIPCCRRDAENSEAYRLLALSLEALGQSAEAGSAFRQSVRYYRASAANEDPGIDYGVFLFRQGQAEDAVAPLEAVLKRHPDAARAYLELGCIELALDHLPQAAAHLERALALDPPCGAGPPAAWQGLSAPGKDPSRGRTPAAGIANRPVVSALTGYRD